MRRSIQELCLELELRLESLNPKAKSPLKMLGQKKKLAVLGRGAV